MTPRPAATVVLVREAEAEDAGIAGIAGIAGTAGIEVLLTLRPATMAFAAGMMVFPGGRVDPADADPRLVARSTLTPDAAVRRLGGGIDGEAALAAHHAAIRELFEEAGILLVAGGARPSDDDLADARRALLEGTATLADVVGDLDVRLDLAALVPIARWVTPAAYARRFDARFFAAELPAASAPTFVGDEVADHRWAAPRAALVSMATGDIEMWIPTSSTLQRLAGIGSFAMLRERLAIPDAPPAERNARPHAGPNAGLDLEDLSADVRRLTCRTAGGVPGRMVETYLVGRRELVVVDPGDPSPEALTGVLGAAAAGRARIVGIVLSSADPASSAGSDELAERTGSPVFGPPGTARELPFPVTELADGADVPIGDRTLRMSMLDTDPPRAVYVARSGGRFGGAGPNPWEPFGGPRGS